MRKCHVEQDIKPRPSFKMDYITAVVELHTEIENRGQICQQTTISILHQYACSTNSLRI